MKAKKVIYEKKRIFDIDSISRKVRTSPGMVPPENLKKFPSGCILKENIFCIFFFAYLLIC